MRVAGIERFGGAVRMLEVAGPRPPGDDEVLIEVKAAGVGNWDDIVRAGDWDVGRGPPMALGVEAAGVVAALGRGVEGWSVGDEVLTHPLPLADQGAWAPRLIARAELLARKPAGVSWVTAGAFAVPALTAVQVIDEALRIEPGETLLINGAGGATGGLLVSLAVRRDVCVLATSSASTREQVSRAGAATVVDHRDQDWPRQILAATGGHGVDAAANAARGGAASAIEAVRDGGRLATITSDAPDLQRGIDIRSVYVRPDAAQLEQAAEELASGRVTFNLGARFPLTQAAAALARAAAGGGAIALEL